VPRRATFSALAPALLLCLWAAGCGGGCSGSSAPPADPGPDPAPGAEEGTGGEDRAGAAEPPVDPGPEPVLRVTGEPSGHAPRVAIRIENRGDEAAELATALGLQRRAGEAWRDVEPVELALRFSCEDPVPDCVTLAPGAVYLPPPWLGTTGEAQCECAECGPAEPGEYRFVVRSCSRAHAVAGEPFTR